MIRSTVRTRLAAFIAITALMTFTPIFTNNLLHAQVVAAPAQAAATELPVTRAVLFASGVGYFEHSGTVEGDATVRLLFKTDQINDVLKSMTVMDDGGGNVSTVSYPSNDPLTRSLRSFGVDISSNPTLADLLNQLRGATVTVSAPDAITGQILNVQSRTRVVGTPPAQVVEQTLTLVTDAGFKSIPMETIQNLTLADPKLRDELNKALMTLVASRDTDRKPVEVKFEGKGKRNVRVGYLVETPVWKTSYRLDISGEKPFLQGWAIVENASEIDWQHVGLSLVSGRPISFRMDLYTPLYAQRPLVVPPMFSSLMPRIYEEGMSKDKEGEARSGLDRKREMNMPMSPAVAAARPAMAKALAAEQQLGTSNALGRQMQSNMQVAGNYADAISESSGGVRLNDQAAQASGSSMGELFSFTLAQPVELPRRRSAMLPIVNQAISAEKVSIYNASVLQKNPLNGLLLVNNTKLKLLAGPITVFDAGAYAGDAQIDHLAPNDKRLIGYGVDLSMTVDNSVSSTSNLTNARIIRGILYLTRKVVFSQSYAMKNKSDAARTVILEHPFNNDRKLVSPEKYEEKTTTLYRFRAKIDAGKTETLTVKEEQPITETIALLPASSDTLIFLTKNTEIDKKVRDTLAQAAVMKTEIVLLEQKLANLTNERTSISGDQDRLRQNLNTVGRDSQLGKRYLTKFNDQETRLEDLDKQIAETRATMEAKQKAYADYIEKLEVN